jgi:hypothetical protein
MKKSILLTVTALLLTACNFTIFGENDDEVVLEKRNITIVERNITIEELSGKWVIEDESIERNLKFNNKLSKERVKIRKKELRDSYISIYDDGTVTFKDSFNGGKIYKGRIVLAYLPTIWSPVKNKDDYYITIMYRYKDSYGLESSKGKDLYFLKLNNKFYLGEKYYGGEEETNSQKMYYLLYKKVISREVNNGKN